MNSYVGLMELYADCAAVTTPYICYNQERTNNFIRFLDFIPAFIKSEKLDILQFFKNSSYATLERKHVLVWAISKALTAFRQHMDINTLTDINKLVISEAYGYGNDVEALTIILFQPWCIYIRTLQLEQTCIDVTDLMQDVFSYRRFCSRHLGAHVYEILLNHPLYGILLRNKLTSTVVRRGQQFVPIEETNPLDSGAAFEFA